MISFPKGLKTIEDEAFYGCSAFYNQIAEIPNSVAIGKRVFKGVYLKELRTIDPEFVDSSEGQDTNNE